MSSTNKKELRSEELLYEIRQILNDARNQTVRTVNTVMLLAYWNIGKVIVEAQGGEDRARYGDRLLEEISGQMLKEFGRTFSVIILRRMRAFYLAFPIQSTVSIELTWSHYSEIISLKNIEERSWYLEESIKSNWSVRQLRRAINTLTYNRILEQKSLILIDNELIAIDNERPENSIKNPYIFDFLGISKDTKIYEKDLEDALISHLSEFLLELGKGFSLYSRQFRILGENNKTYHCDLVFYNNILKCFVAIDLKVGALEFNDVAQIDMYRRYIDEKVKQGDDNPTIGLLLVSSNNETIIKYSILNDNQNLFVSKYLTVMPSEEELKRIIREEKLLLKL